MKLGTPVLPLCVQAAPRQAPFRPPYPAPFKPRATARLPLPASNKNGPAERRTVQGDPQAELHALLAGLGIPAASPAQASAGPSMQPQAPAAPQGTAIGDACCAGQCGV